MSPSLSPQASFYASIAIYLGSIYTVDLLSTRLRVPHLHTEWLCWCFLLVASKFDRGSKVVDTDAGSRADQLALAIAAVSLFRTIGDSEWAIVGRVTRVAHTTTTDSVTPTAHTHAIVLDPRLSRRRIRLDFAF